MAQSPHSNDVGDDVFQKIGPNVWAPLGIRAARIGVFQLFVKEASIDVSYQHAAAWRWPDSSSFAFAYGHYLGPLIPLFLLCAVSLLSGRVIMNRNGALDIVFLCRVAVVFSAAVMLHFNLKLWAPLINPNNYDGIFWSLDQAHPLPPDVVMALHEQITGTLPLMANPYS